MATTLIGRLQLLIQAKGLGEAKKIVGEINKIEAASRKLANAPWGGGFQKQLDKLGLNSREIRSVQTSWNNLQNAIANGGMNKALRKNEISSWKTATLGHFAAVRASMKELDRQAAMTGRNMRRNMEMLYKPALVAGGAYTGTYFAGTMGRQALIAGSKEARVQAEAKYSGMTPQERAAIDARANQLAGTYRLSKADVLGVLKDSLLSMKSQSDAMAVSDADARAFLVLSNSLGDADAARGGLIAYKRAMDNIQRLDPDTYVRMLDNFVKMQQVLGPDLNPQGFAQAIKFSRTGGKVFGEDFLSRWLPLMIAETGGPDAGTKLRAGFDQFLSGKATKKSLTTQRNYGLRDENNRLIDEAGFVENPVVWIDKHVRAAMAKRGMDSSDNVELARVIGDLTSNRLAGDLLSSVFYNMDQYRRLLDRSSDAAGLGAANSIQADNPFAALSGFKDAMSNLSAAILPMPTISAGLNSLSDGINAFAQKLRLGDPTVLTGLGIGAAAVGGFAAWKGTMGLLALATAGPALHSAAAALTAAAVAQGGGLPGEIGKKGGLWKGLAKWGPWAAVAAGLGAATQYSVSTLSTDYANMTRSRPGRLNWQGFGVNQEIRRRDAARSATQGGNYEGGFHRAYAEGSAMPGEKIAIDPAIVADAQRIGEQVKTALSPTGSPVVDMTSMQAALALAQQLQSVITGLGAQASATAAKISADLRRAHSDFGVAP